MKISAVVASRMTSTRLPGKIMMDLCGQPALIRLIERLKNSKYIHQIVIATTTNQQDDIIVEVANKMGVLYHRGSEEDVLLRTVEAALATETDLIVQITSDCPLLDAETVDKVIEHRLENPFLDYVSNSLVRTYPMGFSVEVFKTAALQKVEQLTQDPADREHVSLYMYERPEIFHLSNIEAPNFLRHPEYRLTLDTKEDYQVISNIYDKLYPDNPFFNLYDITRYLQGNPNVVFINQNIKQKKAR
ncbi:spore coat polysaccharide biosynthesis protein SpsF [Paenibacillus sp. 1_12]|uniref:cytidylyltransferase domain-containing protein n=1 Tax=Paenibacillus sp. 1_12 TaxID=1566278 RepID=UPI0008E366AB|nr:glycosyltransferase family protein [Paenibacillus sp. 1_12]SFL89507.1 spore coat polysaccharide biosynthesis protein SpsF [Paenibacillus sp. 1_12]